MSKIEVKLNKGEVEEAINNYVLGRFPFIKKATITHVVVSDQRGEEQYQGVVVHVTETKP